jgi:hypothetical protein
MRPEAMGPVNTEDNSLLEEKGVVSAVLYGMTPVPSQRCSSHTRELRSTSTRIYPNYIHHYERNISI